MARPQKVGLDYFALDVYMSDEIELIEAEHGLEGFAIIIKLYQKIYSEGYFYKWDDREQILFSNRISTDKEIVSAVVSDCIKWEIFDPGLYEKYEILTSRRIQSHYISATYKRVSVDVMREYLLVDISDRGNLNVTSVSDDRNPPATIVPDDNPPEDDDDREAELEFQEDSEEIKLARFMITEMLKVKPDSRVPKNNIKALQGWAKQVDYLIRLDKKTPRAIAELFRWAQQDSFWCANVRSPRKLREQWDRLELQKNNRNNNDKKASVGNDRGESKEYGW